MKSPIYNEAILNVLYNGSSCTLSSIPKKLHPNKSHVDSTGKPKASFNKLNVQDLDFIGGVKMEGTRKLEKSLNATFMVFELQQLEGKGKESSSCLHIFPIS